MKKIIEFLKQLEFSETEAKLYIILLERGSMTVSELAEKAKLNRTATYGYISRLIEKGVVAKSTGSSNRIIANPPEHLHYLVEEKLSHANILKEQLFPVITTLNQSFRKPQDHHASEIKHYKGKKSVAAIYNECLRSLNICTYFDSEDLDRIFPENTMKAHNSTLQKPKQVIREIVRKTPTAIEDIKVAKQLGAHNHMYKFFPEDLTLTDNDILIYDGKVAIIDTHDKENVTGVVLHNNAYFNNSRQIFDLLWRLLPEPKL